MQSFIEGLAKLHVALAHLEGTLGASPRLVGATVTLADIVAGSALLQFYITVCHM